VRAVGEIGMHEDCRVPLGTVGALYRLPQNLLNAFGVSQATLVPSDGKWKDASVALENFCGRIAGSVVQYQQVVLAREPGKDLTDFPEEKPDSRGFIVARYTDVNHAPSRE
jgi:hypothetical protein